MKRSPPRIVVLGFAFVLALQIPLCVAMGAETKKDYVVFLGLNVAAGDRVNQFPVVGGSERDVVMSRNGENVTVPRREVTLHAVVEPKLSRSGVVIEALTGEPVHSPATDPAADAQAQMIAMQNVDMDRQEASEQAWREATASAGSAVASAGMVPADSPEKGAANAQADAANAQAAAAGMRAASAIANPTFGEFLPGPGDETGAFDGFEVTFRISTPEPRSNAYGVARFFLQDVLQPASPQKQLLKLFRLRTLNATPRKVIVRTLGIPPGMKVDSFEVHVYADGRELGTNVSAKRVEVTEDEALQFLILSHVQRNRGATLPAQVAQELRARWPQGVSAAGQAGATVDLRITADGAVSATGSGAAIPNSLPAEVDAAVRKVRFLPALAAGQPVDSTGTFAFGELFLWPE